VSAPPPPEDRVTVGVKYGLNYGSWEYIAKSRIKIMDLVKILNAQRIEKMGKKKKQKDCITN
jgi:hypothetical protein